MKKLFHDPYIAVILGIPWLWLVGIEAAEVSRVLAVLGIVALLFRRKFFQRTSDEAFNTVSGLSSMTTLLIWWTAVAAVILITVASIVRVYIGEHGMDHAIFSQAAQSFANGQGFRVTFNRDFVNNFMADHLAPILVVPAALTYIGIPANLTVILCQGAGLLVSLFAVRSIARARGLSETYASLAALIFISIGDLRSQVSWGTQLEYLAIPFTIMAWERHLKQRHWQSVLFALCAASCKETMILWAGGFCLAVLGLELAQNKRIPGRILGLYGSTAVLLGLIFIGYTYGQKYIFDKPYDYLTRISVTEILNPQNLIEKILYLAHFFLFVLFYPLKTQKGRIALITLVPTILMVMVTNFSHMWEFGRQYVAFPAVVVFTSALVTLKTSKGMLDTDLSTKKVSALLICIAFSFGLTKPAKTLYRLWSKPILDTSELAFIERDALIGVSWSAAPFFLEYPNVFHSPASKEFKYLVIAKADHEALEQVDKNGVSECFQSPRWVVFCREG